MEYYTAVKMDSLTVNAMALIDFIKICLSFKKLNRRLEYYAILKKTQQN